MTAKCDPSLIPAIPDLSFEGALWGAGVTYVAGIDEAGRGALAGPVTAAAVILPADEERLRDLRGVRDSKQLTPLGREHWAPRIKCTSLTWGVGYASPAEIDDLGIVLATRLAMLRAIAALDPQPEHLLIDYMCLPECLLPQTAMAKGDSRSLSIAAASILAKTSRDALLIQLDAQYPAYGFARHKGYSTPEHRRALKQQGPTPVHRHSFSWG